MREFTCIVCGKKGIDRSHSYNKKFCSQPCRERNWYLAHRVVNSDEQCCKYNDGVACSDAKCDKCGWNPEVAKKRQEAFYG